jgi:hypothetical protein
LALNPIFLSLVFRLASFVSLYVISMNTMNIS